jgi:hypothetical protein
MTRVGKIARLSQFVREQLNRRIEDGEPGCQVVKWLNGLTPVKEAMDEHFGGRPILEQNLSEWKQGGYKDWKRHQESRALVRDFLAEAEELEEEVGDRPLTDRLTETVALALAGLLRDALHGEEKGPERRAAVLEVARELARLRRGDHEMDRVGIKRERWEREQDAAHEAEMEKMRKKIEWEKIKMKVAANMNRQEYCEGIAAGTLDPAREASIRKMFAEQADSLRECGVEALPAVSQTKSNQIKPDQAKA